MSSADCKPRAPATPASRVAAWARRIIDGFGPERPAVEARRITTRAPAVPARGFVDPNHRKGVRRIAVTFEDATFNNINARAKADGVSFAEAVRRLIERGM